MPQTIKDSDGNEVEVFTEEEVNLKAKEEADRVATEKQAELDAAQAEKEEVLEQLQKLKEKEMNFEKVRKKAEGKDLQLNEELNKKIEELNKKIENVALRPIEDTKTDFIKDKIGEDKQKQELFEYYFKRLGSEAKTKEEVLKASQEAWLLVTGGEVKPGINISTTTSYNYRGDNVPSLTEDAKHIGAFFGNSEKEILEYKKKKGKV